MQIAEIDATDETAPYVAKTYRWDPSEPVATRPLALTLWTREGTERETLYYAHDLRKNVVSLFDAKGLRRASYQYDPYGNITSMEGDMAKENPFRFSSEHHDEDLGLVYYNYRHYNPTDGRWISRDPIAEQGGWNLYGFVGNNPSQRFDILRMRLFLRDETYSWRITSDGYIQVVEFLVTIESTKLNNFADKIANSFNKILGNKCGKMKWRLTPQGREFYLEPPSSWEDCPHKCIYDDVKGMLEEQTEYKIHYLLNGKKSDAPAGVNSSLAYANQEYNRVFIHPDAEFTMLQITNYRKGMREPYEVAFKEYPFETILWHELMGHLYKKMSHPDTWLNNHEIWNKRQRYLCSKKRYHTVEQSLGPFGFDVDELIVEENRINKARHENGEELILRSPGYDIFYNQQIHNNLLKTGHYPKIND